MAEENIKEKDITKHIINNILADLYGESYEVLIYRDEEKTLIIIHHYDEKARQDFYKEITLNTDVIAFLKSEEYQKFRDILLEKWKALLYEKLKDYLDYCNIKISKGKNGMSLDIYEKATNNAIDSILIEHSYREDYDDALRTLYIHESFIKDVLKELNINFNNF